MTFDDFYIHFRVANCLKIYTAIHLIPNVRLINMRFMYFTYLQLKKMSCNSNLNSFSKLAFEDLFFKREL